MSYYRSMPISQLIAGLNDANELVNQGNMSDEDMDALTDRLTAEAQMLTSLDDERERLEQEGIGQQDLHRLENISPGVTAGLNSGDYTFLASQHGLEPALNAIDWGTIGRWGIVGAIIAAIIALIVKIRGGADKSKSKLNVGDAIRQDAEQSLSRINRNLSRRTMVDDQSIRDIVVARNKEMKTKIMEDIEEKFSGTEKGKPSQKALVYLPIEQIILSKGQEQLDMPEQAMLYGFCFDYGLNLEQKQQFLAFETIYRTSNKSCKDIEVAVRKDFDQTVKSVEIMDDKMDKIITALTKLKGLYGGELSLQDYYVWEREASMTGMSQYMKDELDKQTDSKDLKEVVASHVETSLITTDLVSGFYTFDNIAKPSHAAASELRIEIFSHLDKIEKGEKALESKVKKFEELSKEITSKTLSGSDASKITRDVNSTLSRLNASILGHHKRILSSTQTLKSYINYGDVGIASFKILSRKSEQIINIIIAGCDKGA